MITGNDRMTPAERSARRDCLVEIAMAWLQRPLGGQCQDERARAITEMCFVISQMRHRDARLMDDERLRWIERVAIRLCQQSGFLVGDVLMIERELSRRMLEQLLRYHDWREQVARPFAEMERTGPSDGGEGMA